MPEPRERQSLEYANVGRRRQLTARVEQDNKELAHWRPPRGSLRSAPGSESKVAPYNDDGRLAEQWVQTDYLSFVEKLGITSPC